MRRENWQTTQARGVGSDGGDIPSNESGMGIRENIAMAAIKGRVSRVKYVFDG